MSKRFFLLSFILLISLILAQTQIIYAQEEENVEEEQQPKLEEINDIQKLYNKADEYEEDKKTLESRLKELTEIASIEKTFNSSKDYINQCNQKFKDKKLSKNTDIDSMRTLKSEVAIYSEICSNLKNQIVERLKNIETLKNDWSSRRDYWKELQNQSIFANNLNAKDVFSSGDKTIDEALKLFEGADTSVTKLNQNISELDREINKLIEELEKFIKNLQSRLFKKSHSAMLSSKYFEEFSNVLNNKEETKKDNKQSFSEIYDNYGWVFILQIIVFILLCSYLTHVKEDFLTGFGLRFLHKNYIASSIIISVLFGIPFLLDNYPPMVKLVYTILICISTAIIICEKITNKSLKAGVILVFILYILYKIFDLADIPDAISRLVLAIVSLVAGIDFFKMNSTYETANESTKEETLKVKFVNKIIGVFLVVACILQIAGYTALANHVFHITLKSVLIALLSWILLGFLKSCVRNFFTNVYIEKYLKQVIPNVYEVIKQCNVIITIVVVFLVIAGILAAWGFYDNTILGAKSLLSLGFNIQDIKITVGSVAWAVFLFYVILCVSWCIRNVLENNIFPKRNIEPGVGISINRLIYYSFYVIAFAVAMCVLGISFQNLAVIIGALGVGIGFGLQNIVNNFASGLILLFERSIKVGDIVVVNGTWGTVKHLGLRATIVQTFANAEMIVPNSDLVSGTVNNWTMTNRKTRFTVKIGVAYGTDPELVKSVLLKIADEHSVVLRYPAPSVVFTEFGDSSLNFELRCWVKDIANMWKTQDEIMYEIDKKFKENNISIPFPQRDLYIKEMPSNIKEIVSDNKSSHKKK